MKNTILKSVFILIGLFLFYSGQAAVIYVDTNAPAGGDGTSWGTAYRDLQTGLIAANSGDELWVADGTYIVIGSTDTSFEIPSGVAVYGGFNGTEGARAMRDWKANVTILDGLSNIHTIVYFEDSNSNTILDGFTIQNGFADGTNTQGRSGAAIFINVTGSNSANPTIANCIIKDCHSDANGGAVYIDGSVSGSSAPTFENCTFDNNDTFNDGGAFYGSGVSGGVCTVTFEQCTFTNNLSVGSGGAIFLHGGDGNATSTFNKCNFENNTSEGNGGAIYSLGTGTGQADHTITNSRFYANKGFAAGAIYNNGGSGGTCSPSIINCTFYLNETTGSGGTGGAVYNNASNSGTSSTLISNCIIYGNIAPFGSHVLRNVDASPTIQYSLVDVADCSALNSGAGSNVTCGTGMLYDTNSPDFENIASGDLRLKETSPAIDAGNDADNSTTQDLDCENRFVNAIDMGAYERLDQSLPIDLAEFIAYLDEDKVVLFWTTLSEEENARFTIQRSQDGVNFDDLFSVEGAGNSTTARTYKEYDFHPNQGFNYYRLKNISYTGLEEYSPIKIVELAAQKINIFPNPVEDHLTIAFSDFSEDQAQYGIYNIYGKLIYEGSTPVDGSMSFITLNNIGSFVPGYYILKVYSPKNGSYNHRFQKIRD